MMKRALSIARKGVGFVSPNPMVGAVLVRDGKVVAEGFHKAVGSDHAEIDALKKVGFEAGACDMYVSLEPCVHYGRTPPCTDALIKAGLRKIHIAMIDPNPLVAGKGGRELRAAGIEVEVGLLEEDARRLNGAYIKHITEGKPFVVAKAAMTLDGKIATGTGDSGQNSGGITGPESHRYVHRLRRELDAVLVGAGTVKADNPLLTCRLPGKSRQPLRVILDGLGESPADSAVFNTEQVRTLLVTTRESPENWRREVDARGVELLLLPGRAGKVDIDSLLLELGRREVTSLLVEGGSDILAGFLAADAIDRFDLIYAPRIIGGREIPVFGGEGVSFLDLAYRLKIESVRRMGNDVMLQAYPNGGGD